MALGKIKIAKFILYLFFLLVVAELTLRLQQKLGPVYRLEFTDIHLNYVSDTLNHRNPPGEVTGKPRGYFLGYPPEEYKRSWGEHGIRQETMRPLYPTTGKTITILFMGDSFMEGFGDKHTIPQYIWEYFQTTPLAGAPINLLNVACCTYSPVIYIAQAKQVIPLLKPDIVVVDIDESDYTDDLLRYNDLLVRDQEGKIIAVKRSPLLYTFLNGFVQIQKQPLYLVRLVMKFYHTRIYMPPLYRMYPQGELLEKESRRYINCLGGETETQFQEGYPAFRKNILELNQTIAGLLKDKNRFLITYHSNNRRIKNRTKIDTPLLAALRSASKETGTLFYDATQDLTREFGNNPERYYIQIDTLKHFNFRGLKIYSECIAKELMPLITSTQRLKNK